MIRSEKIRVYSVDEVAQIMGKTRRWVQFLCKEARIKGAHIIGRNWFIPLGADGLPVILPGVGRRTLEEWIPLRDRWEPVSIKDTGLSYRETLKLKLGGIHTHNGRVFRRIKR